MFVTYLVMWITYAIHFQYAISELFLKKKEVIKQHFKIKKYIHSKFIFESWAVNKQYNYEDKEKKSNKGNEKYKLFKYHNCLTVEFCRVKKLACINFLIFFFTNVFLSFRIVYIWFYVCLNALMHYMIKEIVESKQSCYSFLLKHYKNVNYNV